MQNKPTYKPKKERKIDRYKETHNIGLVIINKPELHTLTTIYNM